MARLGPTTCRFHALPPPPLLVPEVTYDVATETDFGRFATDVFS